VPVSVDGIERGNPSGDQKFEEFEIAEEELLDAYVRGELSLDERRLIEKGLRSSPELVECLHFARLLADAADRSAAAEAVPDRPLDPLPPARKTWLFGLTWGLGPAFKLAFAACALIVLIGTAGLFASWIKLRRESRQLAEQQAALERQKLELQKTASEQQLAADQLRAQLREAQQQRESDQQRIAELIGAQNQKPTGSAGLATLLLFPASRSSGKDKELKLSTETSKIRLQLAIDSIDYRSFLIEIRNAQERVILQPKASAPRSGRIVSTTIDKKLLPTGTYSVQLSGISPDGATELVGNYNFRIAATHK